MGQNKFKISIDSNVLNHLGLNLYSDIPPVIAEIIANSYDADATEVRLNISDDKIKIFDNGCGMSADDINEKFLNVGYQKRKNNNLKSPVYKRAYMGRKGIGKLSIFAIANNIKIYTKKNNEKNAFELSLQEIKKSIDRNKTENIPISSIDWNDNVPIENTGTVIELTNLKKQGNKSKKYIKTRIARRFTVLDEGFKVFINDEQVTYEDRNYFSNINCLWNINNGLSKYNVNKDCIKEEFNGKISDDLQIRGWIGTPEKPTDIKGNNKVSIIIQGKLTKDNILNEIDNSGIVSKYIIGEIEADFLDYEDEDIITSSRQDIDVNNERYKEIIKYLKPIYNKVITQWKEFRGDQEKKDAFKIAGIQDWYSSLNKGLQAHADNLFRNISKYSKIGEGNKKELYKNSILAFEKMQLHSLTDKISKLDFSIEKFGELFNMLDEIEATTYYDITKERLEIIHKLKNLKIENQKERVLQKYIYDHLWLLDSAWERASSGSEYIEKRILDEFNILNDDERKGRVDIRYKTTEGKHLILELKRYSVRKNIYDLIKQVSRYQNGLDKILKEKGESSPIIEGVVIIGKLPTDSGNELTIEEANKYSKYKNIRFITYDMIIDNSYEKYKQYINKNKELGRIRELLEKIDNS